MHIVNEPCVNTSKIALARNLTVSKLIATIEKQFEISSSIQYPIIISLLDFELRIQKMDLRTATGIFFRLMIQI